MYWGHCQVRYNQGDNKYGCSSNILRYFLLPLLGGALWANNTFAQPSTNKVARVPTNGAPAIVVSSVPVTNDYLVFNINVGTKYKQKNDYNGEDEDFFQGDVGATWHLRRKSPVVSIDGDVYAGKVHQGVDIGARTRALFGDRFVGGIFGRFGQETTDGFDFQWLNFGADGVLRVSNFVDLTCNGKYSLPLSDAQDFAGKDNFRRHGEVYAGWKLEGGILVPTKRLDVIFNAGYHDFESKDSGDRVSGLNARVGLENIFGFLNVSGKYEGDLGSSIRAYVTIPFGGKNKTHRDFRNHLFDDVEPVFVYRINDVSRGTIVPEPTPGPGPTPNPKPEPEPCPPPPPPHPGDITGPGPWEG
jgi:hypothetical protein